MRFVKAVFIFFSCFLVALTGAWAQTTVISLDAGDWTTYSPAGGSAVLESGASGVSVYGSGYRLVTEMKSKTNLDLRSATVYIKWQPYGPPTKHSAIGVGLAWEDSTYSPGYTDIYAGAGAGWTAPKYGDGFTTNNSWEGSYVLIDDTWYYTRFTIEDDASVIAVTTTGNYDDAGGTPFYSYSYTLAAEVHDLLAQASVYASIRDNYGSTSTRLTIGEAKVVTSDDGDPLAVDPSSLETVVNGTSSFTVSGGVEPYSAIVGDESVANAIVAEADIIVYGLSPGTTSVTVTDSLGQSVDVTVTVDPDDDINSSELLLSVSVSDLNVSLSWTAIPDIVNYTVYYALYDESCDFDDDSCGIDMDSISAIELDNTNSLSASLWSGAFFYTAVIGHYSDGSTILSNIEEFMIFTGELVFPETGNVLLEIRDEGGLGTIIYTGTEVSGTPGEPLQSITINSDTGENTFYFDEDGNIERYVHGDIEIVVTPNADGTVTFQYSIDGVVVANFQSTSDASNRSVDVPYSELPIVCDEHISGEAYVTEVMRNDEVLVNLQNDIKVLTYYMRIVMVGLNTHQPWDNESYADEHEYVLFPEQFLAVMIGVMPIYEKLDIMETLLDAEGEYYLNKYNQVCTTDEDLTRIIVVDDGTSITIDSWNTYPDPEFCTKTSTGLTDYIYLDDTYTKWIKCTYAADGNILTETIYTGQSPNDLRNGIEKKYYRDSAELSSQSTWQNDLRINNFVSYFESGNYKAVFPYIQGEINGPVYYFNDDTENSLDYVIP